jgi:hypothetical protein
MTGWHGTVAGASAALVLLGGAYWQGWSDRGTREAARQTALLAERRADAARIMGLTEALERARSERDQLARELEDAALADDSAGRLALPADSVRRIDRR